MEAMRLFGRLRRRPVFCVLAGVLILLTTGCITEEDWDRHNGQDSGVSSDTTTGQCNCTESSGPQCSDESHIKICNQCRWQTHSCATVCKAGEDGPRPTIGCLYSYSSHGDRCICTSPGKSGIVFNVTDKCAKEAVSISFYDMTGKTKSETFSLSYNKVKQFLMECKKGHKICFGAWSKKYYWGCGQNCQEESQDEHCYQCNSTFLVRLSLRC